MYSSREHDCQEEETSCLAICRWKITTCTRTGRENELRLSVEYTWTTWAGFRIITGINIPIPVCVPLLVVPRLPCIVFQYYRRRDWGTQFYFYLVPPLKYFCIRITQAYWYCISLSNLVSSNSSCSQHIRNHNHTYSSEMVTFWWKLKLNEFGN